MTARTAINQRNKIMVSVGSVLGTMLIFLPAVFFPSQISAAAKRGLLLSLGTVIPSIFPFIVLTDFAARYIRFESVDALRYAFERLFRIGGCGLSVFLSGILGGFPLGAHRAIELYKSGKISKSECERLMGFASNASPGYVISAVGTGMIKSTRAGILLYIIAIASAMLSGMIFGIKNDFLKENEVICEQSYSFVSSVKGASAICITVTAFITIFSVIGECISVLISANTARLLILPFLEIGCAVSFISECRSLESVARMSLIAFSISFSGLSVYAQTASLTEGTDLSMHTYLKIKLLGACIAATLAFFVFSAC